MPNTTKTKCVPAFTLVEILAVIVLIGLLAVFVVPPFFQKIEPAKAKIAKAQIMELDSAVAGFFTDCSRFPDQSEGLRALLAAPAGLENKWAGPYCKETQLKDPWGFDLTYQRPGTNNLAFDIISRGADGQPGGEGPNADVFNN